MLFIIDTGAQCNANPLRKSNARLIVFGGHRLKSALLLCEHKSKLWPVEFEVLENVSNVLGLKASTELKLVQRVEMLDMY
jgi:hypothetical protein